MFDYNKIGNSCVKCGKCIPKCTIHSINSDETTSPRGFLDLLRACKNGDLKLDKNAKKIFESCFLCTNCVEICPNSLPVDQSIENIRFEIAKKFGISWWKKVVFWFLSHRKILDFCAKFGYVFQSCGFKILQNQSMKPRFSLPIVNLKKERILPSLAQKSFLNSHENFINNGGEKSVGIFIGCLSNYAYTSVGEALLKILKTLKINVNLMKDQSCCGAPQYFTGDFKSVEKLAKKNIVYFEEILKTCDAIIIPEATCSAMIKIDYEHFFKNLGNDEFALRAKNISEKIFMATEYFAKFTNLAEILENFGQNGENLTYHDACHAKKMQGIFKEPRELLSKNYKIIEMEDSNQCCGFGGVTMQTQNYHLSRKAGIKKANMIKNLNTKIVSAECSACKMQLNNVLNLIHCEQKCINPIELIAKNL